MNAKLSKNRIAKQESSRKPVLQSKIKRWKSKKEHGDIELIGKVAGFSAQTIANAFKGTAKKEVVDAIDSYYGINTTA